MEEANMFHSKRDLGMRRANSTIKIMCQFTFGGYLLRTQRTQASSICGHTVANLLMNRECFHDRNHDFVIRIPLQNQLVFVGMMKCTRWWASQRCFLLPPLASCLLSVADAWIMKMGWKSKNGIRVFTVAMVGDTFRPHPPIDVFGIWCQMFAIKSNTNIA